MNINTGISLAAYINDNSERYSASVLAVAHQAWVILRDSMTGHTQDYIEPIVDVPDYLVRAERRSPRLNAEFRNLLVSWLNEQSSEPADNAEAPATRSRNTAGTSR